MFALALPCSKFHPPRLLVKHLLDYFTNTHFIESINAKSQLRTIFIPHITKVRAYVYEMTTPSQAICSANVVPSWPLLTFQTKVLHLINL